MKGYCFNFDHNFRAFCFAYQQPTGEQKELSCPKTDQIFQNRPQSGASRSDQVQQRLYLHRPKQIQKKRRRGKPAPFKQRGFPQTKENAVHDSADNL